MARDYETSETPDSDFENKSLTCVDAKTGNAMATAVKKNFAWAFAEEVVARWITTLPYQRIILQTDGEPAIKTLARHTSSKLGAHRCEVRQTLRYDSKSNGAGANLDKISAGRARTADESGGR